MHPLLGILGPELSQLGLIIGVDGLRRVGAGQLDCNPAAQQRLINPDLTSDLNDRPPTVHHQMSRLRTISQGVVLSLPVDPTCRHPLGETPPVNKRSFS